MIATGLESPQSAKLVFRYMQIFFCIRFEINWFIILFFHEPSLLFSFLSCLKSDSQVKLFSEALKILFSSRLRVVLFSK